MHQAQTDAQPATLEELADAMAHANLPTLVVAMAQLTGDESWLQEPYRPTSPSGVEDHDDGGLPEPVQQEIRDRALDVMRRWRAGELPEAPPPEPDQIVRMLDIALGSTQDLPPDIGPLLAEELGVLGRDVVMPAAPAPDRFRVLVIGAGFAGLCAAIKLGAAGIAYDVLERNDDVGGTWLENRYPGCGVDTPSHLYSYSFAQRADWSRYFAKREEVFAYLRDVADEYGLRRNIHFGHEVLEIRWDEEQRRWHVTARDQAGRTATWEANVVISGVGFFNAPAFPDIPGLDRFAGPCVHTARWRPVELRDRRVGVIGTGASAMQLVPAVVDETAHLTVFQRSPQWGLPNPNYLSEVNPAKRLLMREVPHYLGWYRLRQVWNFGDRLHPALQIDPDWRDRDRSINETNDRHRRFLERYIAAELGERTDLLEKCIPDYPPYGKRPLLDNGWFRTMARDDVELVTDPIAEVRERSVLTEAGEEHELDVLVVATGFKALEVLGPIEVVGRGGRTLREVWGRDDARAHLGISVPGFPNLFFLLGPNTFAGHGGSAMLTIEMGLRYVMKLIARMIEEDLASVECRQDAHETYGRELDDALDRTIWAHPGMSTYYRNSRGRIVIPMPWTNTRYWHLTETPDMAHFHVESAVGAAG